MSHQKEFEDKAQKEAETAEQMRLSAPWGGTQAIFPTGQTKEAAEAMASAVQISANVQRESDFLRVRSRLHEVYIVEQERTKRCGLVVSCVLILVGATILLFAPPGREAIANWLGAALLVSAAGAVGFAQVRAKSALLEISASGNESRSGKS